MSDALKTDLYQLTMMAGYWSIGSSGPATFELSVRRLPPTRSYLVACGLEQALQYLERLSFDAEERAWLKQLPQFARIDPAFFDSYLATFSFQGDVWAIQEGTPVFEHEPLVRVTAPLPQAQLVETALLATITYQTSVATKAARLVDAASRRPVVEFGARHAHGIEAALEAARAAYVGGCEGSSFVEAGRRFAIPTSGTMAHSWVQAFPTELEAFRAFERKYADFAVYLLDTYDSRRAAVAIAASGLRPRAVRLDSGDLVALSREVRGILDEAGLTETRIIATGDLDEWQIESLIASGATVDAFGVGTALTAVTDAPSLSGVYKLVEVDRAGRPAGVIKLSPGKETWPGPKQVWRTTAAGLARGDVIAAADEPEVPGARPLLRQVMAGGRRLEATEALDDVRARCQTGVASLDRSIRQFDRPAGYPVTVSETLERRRQALRPAISESEGPNTNRA